MVGALFREIDKHTGCLRPEYLGPNERTQGQVVLERRAGNIHAHILISCRSEQDQICTYLRLFELLDTVFEGDRKDDAEQRDAWDLIIKMGWLSEDARGRTHSPLLHRFAPGATATVQRIATALDLRRVSGYLTKELAGASNGLALVSDHWADKADFCVRELSEFHSRAGYERPATRVRKNPNTGALVLDLDHPFPWKRDGKRIRR